MYKGIVYMYTSPSGKKYIGETINEKRRREEFRQKRMYSGLKISSAIKKYGAENFQYDILEELESEDKDELVKMLLEKENFYINKYKSNVQGYNTNNLKNIITSRTYTEAVEQMKRNLRNYYKTHDNPMKGKKLTQDEKKKISERQKEFYKTHNSPFKGKHLSDSAKKKISDSAKTRTNEKNPFFGKHHTEATKKIISEKNSKPVLQIDKNTGVVINEFPSAISAARFFGKEKSDITKVCKGTYKIKTCFGYKWKYKE